jgi:tetratricopeptide (TPR) repeat protein
MAAMVSAVPVCAQHSHDSLPVAATELHPGLGEYRLPISTASPDAQVYFDQGLNLLYGFNHDEAARYFRRAAELDPAAPMPFWGLALSIGPNYNDTAVDANRAQATFDAVQNALQRAGNGTAREQACVRAIAKRYASPDPASDWKALHLDYSNAMRELVASYPDDLDAATMFAESLMMLRPWQLWDLQGNPAPGTLELVAVLESVLKRNPDHPGANHFYIHAVEASHNLERAIPSAERLRTLMPGAGHLVHMPGHIYLQTGDYDLAAETNVRAAAADADFVRRTGATGVYPLMYWTHNIHFVAYARAQQGRYDDALQAAREMTRNVGNGDIDMQMLEGFLLYPLMVQLRFHRWQEILEEPQLKPERKVYTAFRGYARAMALAGLGRVREADKERKRFEMQRKSVPAEAQFLINNKAGPILDLSAATLDAQLHAARGGHEASVEAWQRAVELEKSIQYDEPPAWFYPVRQSLAAELLKAGRAAEAETNFRNLLDKHPRDGRILYGLWQSLLAQERADEAAVVERQFNVAWRDATEELSVGEL